MFVLTVKTILLSILCTQLSKADKNLKQQEFQSTHTFSDPIIFSCPIFLQIMMTGGFRPSSLGSNPIFTLSSKFVRVTLTEIRC